MVVIEAIQHCDWAVCSSSIILRGIRQSGNGRTENIGQLKGPRRLDTNVPLSITRGVLLKNAKCVAHVPVHLSFP